MLNSHKNIITSNLTILVEETDLNRLVPALLSRNVFNGKIIKRILDPSHSIKHQKTDLYVEILKRGPEAFAKLQDALLESNHRNLADILRVMDTQNLPQTHRSSSLNSVGSNRSLNSSDNDCDTATYPYRRPYGGTHPPPNSTDEGSHSQTYSKIEKKSEDFHDTQSTTSTVESTKLCRLPDYLAPVTEAFLNMGSTTPDDFLDYVSEKYRPVRVKQATGWPTQTVGKPLVYKMDSLPRGCALLVNNYEFADKEEFGDREGSDNDEKRMTELLQQLHYEVEVYTNKTKREMEDILKAFSSKEELFHVDSIFVTFMSHGEEGESEEDSEIVGIDGIGLKTKDIVSYFNHDCCKALILKPKIFFFQACRGILVDPGVIIGKYNFANRIVTDGKRVSSQSYSVKIRSQSDVLIACPVPPGKSANRDKITGTWFIQTFVDVASAHAWNTHLEDLLKMVDERIQKLNNLCTSNFQTVTTNTMGWNKNLYFSPGLYRDKVTGATMRVQSDFEQDEGMDVVDLVSKPPQNSDKALKEEEDEDDEDTTGCFSIAGCSTS